VRTNCLDSLDRTNVVQSKIAWRVLREQLKQQVVDLESQYLNDGQILIDAFRKLWVDNGNSLSILYSGTESTTAGITRAGKEGFLSSIASRFNSMNRFYNNNFKDNYKQEYIECLLGEGKFSRASKSREGHVLKVLVVTWNLAGIKIDSNIYLTQLLGVADSP
jgi:hypothetical protein